MIRELPGPPVEEWIARMPAGSHAERKAWLQDQGLSSNHASAVLRPPLRRHLGAG